MGESRAVGEGAPGRPRVVPSAELPPPDPALRYDVGSPGAVPALAAWLGEASPDEIAALAGEVAVLPPASTDFWVPRGRFESWWWRVLFYGWTAADQTGAEEFVRNFRLTESARDVVDAMDTDFAIALAWREPGAGVALAEARGVAVVAGVLGHLAELSPAGLLDLVRGLPALDEAGRWAVTLAAAELVAGGGELPYDLDAVLPATTGRGDYGSGVVRELVASDPDRAIALAHSLEGRARADAMDDIARSLLRNGETGPRIDAVLEELPPSRRRSMLAVEAAAARALEDPVAARAWVEAKFQGAEREMALAAVVAVESESDPAAALRFVVERGGQVEFGHGSPADLRRTLRESMAAILETESPGEVLAQLVNVPDAASGVGLVSSLARAWSEDDPAEASRALAPLAAHDLFRRSVVESLTRWADSDPGAAIALAATTSGRPDGDGDLIEPLFAHLAKVLPDRSVAMVSEVPEARRVAAANEIVEAAYYRTPEVAARALELLASEDTDPAMWERVGGRYAQLEPLAVLDWVAGLPLGAAAEGAHRSVAESLAISTPEHASVWVESLPPGAPKDAAIAGLVRATISGSDPPFAVALAWANQAASAESRAAMTRDVLEHWRDQDAVAAATAADELGVPFDDAP